MTSQTPEIAAKRSTLSAECVAVPQTKETPEQNWNYSEDVGKLC